jgi:hypothetical protein
MPLVVLIPTGSLERLALKPSLERLFPSASFEVRPKGRHLNSFTHRDVTTIPVGGPMTTEVEESAEALVAAVEPGRKDVPADYACVVEDLELANDHQPDQVVRVFRDGVERHLNSFLWPTAQGRRRAFDRVRERCSFHLFRPMTEAYFYGEPDALRRAGAVQPPQLHHADLERFQIADQPYLQIPDGRFRQVADMPHRRHHPKCYLHYLCDPTLADRRRRYRETQAGAAALRDLDWQQVLAQAPHCPFLHAFLDDLAEALNQKLPFVDQARACPLTRYLGAQRCLLRNA